MPPKSPGPVPEEALRYFERKGLKPAYSYLDVWREEHSVAFTVAKVLERDILEEVRDMVKAALKDGTTFEQFKKDALPKLAKSGWIAYVGDDKKYRQHRMRIIYNTNMRVARAAGQWERIERTKRARPFLRYELGPSEKHRELHASWAGTTLPVDDPWWNTHMTPCGWGCKCRVRQLSRREAARLGGETERPPLNRKRFVNKRTGKVSYVPDGIDPGFDYNPGKNRTRGLLE